MMEWALSNNLNRQDLKENRAGAHKGAGSPTLNLVRQ